MDTWLKVFALFGAASILAVIIAFGMIAFEMILEKYEKWKHKYKYKHRFDKKPVAACYCIDCEYYGQGPYKESCGLSGVDRLMGDSQFCSLAEPKERGRQ